MSVAALWLDRPTGRRRFGVKGPRAAEMLKKSGLTVPARPNTWAPLRAEDRDDSPNVIGRLGFTEFFIEHGPDVPGLELEQRLVAEAGVYPVLREDFGMVLGGLRAAEALAEVCNVDFAALPAARKPVVMTLMAGVAVLVLPQRDTCRIWCDPSLGSYLWETLAEVARATTSTTTNKSNRRQE